MKNTLSNAFAHMNRIERLVAAAVIANLFILVASACDLFHEDVLEVLELTVMAIFVVDVIARWKEAGMEGFHDGWLLFDTALTLIGLVPATNSVAGLRMLRVVRVLRLVHLGRHTLVHARGAVWVAREARRGAQIRKAVA